MKKPNSEIKNTFRALSLIIIILSIVLTESQIVIPWILSIKHIFIFWKISLFIIAIIAYFIVILYICNRVNRIFKRSFTDEQS